MPEKFDDKNYGEYFSAIQKNLDKKPNLTHKSEVKNQHKKTFGGIFRLRPWVCVTVVVLVATLIVTLCLPKKSEPEQDLLSEIQNTQETVEKPKKEEQKPNYFASFSDNTAEIGAEIDSQCVVVVNCNKNQVVASRNATERCYPASTTKIMTILTAVDYITDYNDTFTFSYEITDPFHKQGSSMAGFANEEKVTITDMFYGAILPSGADATAGLAEAIAGSEENFVKLMNKKAKELGLRDTNFTNTSGLFDKNHYTTAEDMAVIVRAAMQNQVCREVLCTYKHTTASTPQHPEGIPLASTLFSYMYGTEPEGADILGGKTGYVNESGYCIASFGKSDTGDEYVCVTLKGLSLWPTIYDQIDLYSHYAK